MIFPGICTYFGTYFVVKQNQSPLKYFLGFKTKNSIISIKIIIKLGFRFQISIDTNRVNCLAREKDLLLEPKSAFPEIASWSLILVGLAKINDQPAIIGIVPYN